MVSPFTLGLFAPLPLAMMIPFMATQSLAMGEAFGKSFQYGKRKISSMSNEEFNKLTFQNLMDEQTANVKSIIPKLHEQMVDSNEMQQDIFREMTKLIPAFINGLAQGAGDIFGESTGELPGFGTIPNPNITTQATAAANPTTIVNVSHDGESTLTPPSPPTQNSAIENTINMMAQWSNSMLTLTYNQRDANPIPNNSYGITNTKFRQLLVVEAKKRGTATNQTGEEETPTYSKDPTPSAELAYHKKIQTFLTEGVTIFKALTIARNALAKNTHSTGYQQQVKTSTTQINNWTKKIKNYITIARNVGATKAVANHDWNKRIWTTIG